MGSFKGDNDLFEGLSAEEQFIYEAKQAAEENIRETNELTIGDWLLDETNSEVQFSDKVNLECFPGD